MKHQFLIGLLCLSIASCSNIGSTVLPPNRLDYNMSLENSEQQQSLLNIVRLRYSDTPYFMSVNNIVSQFSFATDVGVNVNNQEPPPSLIASGNVSFNYSESPTITYTPMQGEEFVTKLLTPIDLSVIYMLLRSGWNANHVFRMTVNRFGPVENAVLASRTTSSQVPTYKNFLKLGLVFRDLQHKGLLDFVADKVEDKFSIKLIFKRYSALSPEQKRMLSLFGVNQDTPYFWIVSQPTPQKNKIYVETRTVYSLFNYLSKSVDVPQKDVDLGDVPMTYYKNGQLFDWHAVTIGLGRIRTSQVKPTDAYVKIRYRGSWFYVANSDFEEKETLHILALIVGIYQGKVQSFLPVFTVS